MNEKTLTAVISTTRSDMEYLAFTRQDIIEVLDSLMLDVGDVIQIKMKYIANDEFDGLEPATPMLIQGYEQNDPLLPVKTSTRC